jgi:hypothetical protein
MSPRFSHVPDDATDVSGGWVSSDTEGSLSPYQRPSLSSGTISLMGRIDPYPDLALPPCQIHAVKSFSPARFHNAMR